MTSENLFLWLKDTMKVRNIQDVNSPSDLSMICQKQHEDIWKHVMTYIRPKEEVKTVKGNLLLLSNKSKLQQSDANLHIENSNFENERIKKLLDNLKMLKKQHSKIKENNEIISKNNKEIKEKILIHESTKKRMQSGIMDMKGTKRSTDHFKHNLSNIHHSIQHLTSLLQDQHFILSKIVSCSGSMGERESVQADLHRLMMEMKKIANSNHGDVEKQETIIKKLLSKILTSSKPSVILDVLLLMFCKTLSQESIRGSVQRIDDDEFSNIKKLIQDKKEYILKKMAHLHKMKNSKTIDSINISTNSQDPMSLASELQTRKADLRMVEARLKYLDEVMGGGRSGLLREVEELKEKKKLCVSKLVVIKQFEATVMGKHSIITKLMTSPPNYSQLQQLVSDKVKQLDAQNCIDSLYKLDSVMKESLTSLTTCKLHHFDMLDLVGKRPLALLHTTPLNHPQAVFQEVMQHMLRLIDFPIYMSQDLVLKQIDIHDDVGEDGDDDSMTLLTSHLKDCSKRVCEQGESFKRSYTDVLKKDASCLKLLPSLKQVVNDWWHQPAYKEGLTRVVDGMTCTQWMDEWRACVVKVKQ